MAIYEIINPSDACDMEAPSDAIAAAACLLLGGGAYGLREGDRTDIVSIFIFGGDPKTWWTEKYGGDLSGFLHERTNDIADALATVVLDGDGFRLAAEHVPADQMQDFRAKWCDKRRSSMNDICARAWKLADAIRTPEPATN